MNTWSSAHSAAPALAGREAQHRLHPARLGVPAVEGHGAGAALGLQMALPRRDATGAQRAFQRGHHPGVGFQRGMGVAGLGEVGPPGGGDVGDALVAVLFTQHHVLGLGAQLAQQQRAGAVQAAVAQLRRVA